jgi:tetratricopeptide (TPR) repeat protein
MLEEVVRINPQDAEAHYHLGQLLYTHTKRTDEAIAHLREAAKLDPTLSDSIQQNEQ